jgi:diguanylate cyclase (GGDEF)-like protein
MSQPPNKALRAIVADDEDLGRLLLAEAVAEAGLVAEPCDNGRAALNAALQPDVGLVLLDVDMPEMDGYEVCRKLRQYPALRNVPVIMVTGHDDSGAINHAFEAGATDFITKPVNWALLPHRLGYFLRNAAGAQALADRETKMQALLAAVPDALWVFSYDGELRWNPDTRGNPPAAGTALAPVERMPEVLAAIRRTAQGAVADRIEYRTVDEHGGRRSFELRFSRCEPDGVLVVRQDTSERARAAERIEKLAYFDTLTGLPNRPHFMDVAEQWLRAAGEDDAVAVVYLDLNSFKRINDSFGHSVGDVVLQAVANRLKEALGPLQASGQKLLLSRFGGDEFVFLVGDRRDLRLTRQVADTALAALHDPIIYNQMEFFSTPSVGVASFPEHATELEKLVKNADTAMYHAKTTGASSYVLYSPALGSRARDWLEMESRLRRAVRDEKLYLHFQPKFWLHNNRMSGVEALVRWFDEVHGEIAAGQFIKIAEESGLIIDLGAWVARAACRQIRSWLDRGIELPVAINVSGKELLHGDPIANIEAAIAAERIPHRLLELEITESVVINESAAARTGLQRLRNLGCKIALDDFGTGYSSLAYITRFPLDRIKIDRAFVRAVDQSSSDAAIASAILSLAKSLDLEVTAEGVERREQLEWLRSRGCHQVQGYLLSRPLSVPQLEARFLGRDTSRPDSDFELREQA